MSKTTQAVRGRSWTRALSSNPCPGSFLHRTTLSFLDSLMLPQIQAQVGMESDSSSYLLQNTSYVKYCKTQLTTETVFQMTHHGSGMSPSQGHSDISKPVRAVFPHLVFVCEMQSPILLRNQTGRYHSRLSGLWLESLGLPEGAGASLCKASSTEETQAGEEGCFQFNQDPISC